MDGGGGVEERESFSWDDDDAYFELELLQLDDDDDDDEEFEFRPVSINSVVFPPFHHPTTSSSSPISNSITQPTHHHPHPTQMITTCTRSMMMKFVANVRSIISMRPWAGVMMMRRPLERRLDKLQQRMMMIMRPYSLQMIKFPNICKKKNNYLFGIHATGIGIGIGIGRSSHTTTTTTTTTTTSPAPATSIISSHHTSLLHAAIAHCNNTTNNNHLTSVPNPNPIPNPNHHFSF